MKKSFIFLSILLTFLIVFSAKTFAASRIVCGDIDRLGLGKCEFGECDEGYIKDINGSFECEEDNTIYTTCCVLDPNAPSVSNFGNSLSTGGGVTSASSLQGQVYASQCSTTNTDGSQADCTHANDAAILEQCKVIYSGEDSACSSMQSYLNKMAGECQSLQSMGTNVSGINCAMISQGGVYGNEASKFANYLANGGSPSGGSSTGIGGLDFDTVARAGLPDAPGVKNVLVKILNWMLSIVFLLTLIAFVISGGQYLLASGDDKVIETAKRNMTYSIIGIIVALSGFVIIRAVDAALRATSGLF